MASNQEASIEAQLSELRPRHWGHEAGFTIVSGSSGIKRASSSIALRSIGGSDHSAKTIYRTRNVSAEPLVAYESAAEDLFAAQRTMRDRDEKLLAIYHSHPRAKNPEPSATDVRLAYYPSAVYLIVGLANEEPSLRAFRIQERNGWEPIEYTVTPVDR